MCCVAFIGTFIHDSSPSVCRFFWQILNKGNLLQFDWATKKRRKHLQLPYIQKFWIYVDSISNILIDSWTYTLFFPWQTPRHNNRFISFRPFWCCCFMNGGWWWWLVVCSLEQWRDLLALHTYPAALACSTFANTGFTNIELYYYCKYKIYRAYRLYCRVLSCIHIQQVWAVLPVYCNGCIVFGFIALVILGIWLQ